MRCVFLLLIVLSTISISCHDRQKETEQATPTSFSELLFLIEDVAPENRAEFVESFLETITEFPIIENNTDVYFIYQGEASSVQVAGDFNGWSPTGKNFVQLADTEVWYRKETFESTARLDYKLVVNGSNWILDPKNPNRISGGFGANSELAMPEYEQPWEVVVNPSAAKGTLSTITLPSSETGKTYTVQVYLPSGYTSGGSYPVAYFQDGGEYVSLASAKVVMDNLMATQAIRPTIGVFVTPTNRNIEYAGGDRFKYAAFFTSELVPYIDSNYATHTDRTSRAVIGDSYGGNISAIISFTYPEVFGNTGWHSGAFQANSYETNDLVMDGINHEIKVVSIWGTYESLYTNMRTVSSNLVATGYDVTQKELPEGHSWGLWRATIDDMLIAFFPAE